MKWWKTAMIAGSMGLVAACGPNLQNIGKPSDPTRFYALASVPVSEQVAAIPAAAHLVLRIGDVTIDKHLDRSQMVRKERSNQLDLAEFDRWAAKPDTEIARVTAQNLRLRLGTPHVLLPDWKINRDAELELNLAVEQMEYDAAQGKVLLGVYWQLRGVEKRNTLAAHYAWLERESGAGYVQNAQALSLLLGELADQIAQAVATAQR